MLQFCIKQDYCQLKVANAMVPLSEGWLSEQQTNFTGGSEQLTALRGARANFTGVLGQHTSACGKQGRNGQRHRRFWRSLAGVSVSVHGQPKIVSAHWPGGGP